MRLQKANRSITILVASLSLASVACVLVSGYFRHRQVTALNARTQSLLLSIQLAGATDKLTAAVRGFAIAGDPRYRDVFLREIHVERNRDRAVEGLQALGLTQQENELVSRAKQSSDALIAQEEKSFQAAERKDFTAAMGYVYGEEYLKAKALIMDPLDEFRRRLDQRLATQALSADRAAQRTANLAIVAAILNALAIGGALIFYRMKMVAPLAALGRSLNDLLARKPGIEIGFQEDRTEIGDIARSLRSYKGLQEERNRVMQQMESLLDCTGQCIYGVNLQGDCTFINRATYDLLGYRPEDAFGRNMHYLVQPAVLAFEPRARLLLVTKAVIESPRGTFEFGAKRVERLLANLEADSASQICETVLQQAYAFGNRPGTRFYDRLHYGKHLGNDDLTAVALVRV